MNWKPFAAAVALVFALGAADAEAASWPWNWKLKSKGAGKKDLPKPIDSPVVRMKTPEHHKPGKRARHRTKYDRPEWGAMWKQTLSVRAPRTVHPWIGEAVR